MLGGHHHLEADVDRPVRPGQELAAAGEGLLAFGVEHVEDHADQEGVGCAVPVVADPVAVGIDQDVGDVLCVPDLLVAHADLEERVVPGAHAQQSRLPDALRLPSHQGREDAEDALGSGIDGDGDAGAVLDLLELELGSRLYGTDLRSAQYWSNVAWNFLRIGPLSTADSRTFHSQPSRRALRDRLDEPTSAVEKPESR